MKPNLLDHMYLRRLLGGRFLPAILTVLAMALPNFASAQVPTFNALITTSANSGSIFPESAAVGDFNGDGNSDAIITVGASNTFRLMLGNGTGTFSVHNVGLPQFALNTVVALPSNLVNFPPSSVSGFGAVQAVDVNHDGKLDVICVENVGINFVNYSFIGVLINTGNDGNGVPQFTATHHYDGAGIRPLTVGDLNGDGEVDFITGNAWGGHHVWIGNGSSAFTSGQAFGLFPGVGNPSAGLGAIADVSGDGNADFVTTSNQNGGANVFLGNGDGTLQTTPTLLANGAVSVVVADVNGDGQPDLLMGNTAIGLQGLYVYLNAGGGTFGAPTLYAIEGLNGGYHGGGSVALSDFNGDGILDAALSLFYNGANNVLFNNIVVLLGDGNGGFSQRVDFQASGFPTYVFADDFNNDGKSDIGTILRNARQFGVLTNTTVFTPPPVVTVFASGISDVIAWDPIYPAQAYPNWTISEDKPVPTVGYDDPRWSNPHPASVFAKNSHPWEYQSWVAAGFKFDANWINAWSNLNSQGPSGHNWTKYSTTVTGEGDFVLQFLADNLSWIYIDGVLIEGYQGLNWNTDGSGRYTIHLSGAGPHELSFIIFDGGGLAGGKFRLETVQSYLDNGGGPLPPPPDTTPPVISGPGNIVTEATGPSGAVVTFTATATDDKDGSVSVLAMPASGSTFALGTTTVDLGASDSAGNEAYATFNVTVQDTTPPIITSPSDITEEATSAAGANVSFSVSATDIVDGSVAATATPGPGTFALGTTAVNVSATDAAGNSSSTSFNVTVQDTTAPALTVPADQVVEATSAAGAVALFSASATDAVGVASLTYSAASGSTFALGTTTVTVTATDAAGNPSSGTFTVTVQDTTAPVLTVPANQVLEATSAAGAVALFSASATDAVGVTSLTTSIPSGATFPLGTTTVTVTASDAAGNPSTGSFTVTVVDTTAPVITSVTPSTGTLWSPNHKMVPITVTVDATDNTGVTSVKIVSVTSNEPDDGHGDGHTRGDFAITGDLTVDLRAERDGKGSGRVYTITVEVTDAYGNTSTSTCTVSVPKSGKSVKSEKTVKSEKAKKSEKAPAKSEKSKDNNKGKKK